MNSEPTKRSFIRAIVLLTLGLFSRTAVASSEADFWRWFQAHDKMLFDFESNQEAVFDQLGARMHAVNASLTFEFGPKQNGQREFVISANGNRAAFPNVEKLFAAAPPLERWKIIKFRPRREALDISYAGLTVKADSVTVVIERDGPKAALIVLLPGYSQAEHDAYGGIAFLLLDQALGEFDVETRVGGVDFAAPSARYSKAIPLKDLPRAFDAFFSQ
ncbi:MAG: hypothetical protein ACJ8GW_05935 [Massilia sp.]